MMFTTSVQYKIYLSAQIDPSPKSSISEVPLIHLNILEANQEPELPYYVIPIEPEEQTQQYDKPYFDGALPPYIYIKK